MSRQVVIVEFHEEMTPRRVAEALLGVLDKAEYVNLSLLDLDDAADVESCWELKPGDARVVQGVMSRSQTAQ